MKLDERLVVPDGGDSRLLSVSSLYGLPEDQRETRKITETKLLALLQDEMGLGVNQMGHYHRAEDHWLPPSPSGCDGHLLPRKRRGSWAGATLKKAMFSWLFTSSTLSADSGCPATRPCFWPREGNETREIRPRGAAGASVISNNATECESED